MPEVAYVGCATDHGGVVLTGKSSLLLRGFMYDGVGRPAACVGDIVSCPIHGNNAILPCETSVKIDDVSTAVHGSETACGSKIIVPPCPPPGSVGGPSSLVFNLSGILNISNSEEKATHISVFDEKHKNKNPEEELKLLHPEENHLYKIAADATWPSLIFNTNKHGAHEWHWHIEWKSNNKNGTHPKFEKSGTAHTSDGLWDTKAVVKNLGGDFTVTVKHDGKVIQRKVKIRGTNPSQQQIKEYLKGKDNWEWLYQIINQESHYKHFDSKYDHEPLTSFDNGFGLCQLTKPKPDYEHIWNWNLHLDAGIELLSEYKHEAEKYLSSKCKTDKPNSITYTDDQLKRETISRWNGGVYYKWDKANNHFKRRNFYCDKSTVNGGWNMDDPINHDKTSNQLKKEDRKFVGVCYVDTLLGPD
ncbi:MAG: PAAR domain-containing protein [Bdellovibrionota bacterium]